ncbi:hypothetical protein [Paracoccus sp. 228]|nr:hypothetical protein [Paracoccus sp. 228]
MNDLAMDHLSADLPAPQIVELFWLGEHPFKPTRSYLRGLL